MFNRLENFLEQFPTNATIWSQATDEVYDLARKTKQQRDSRYKVGLRIRIIHLEGEDTRYDGKEGMIEHIDGIGQLHGAWGGLAIIPEADKFIVIG